MSTNVSDEQTNKVDYEKKNMSDEGSDEHIETALDLNSNPQARIRNPLEGISRAHLLRNVEAFAQEKELTHILPLLNKGAVRKCISLYRSLLGAHLYSFHQLLRILLNSRHSISSTMRIVLPFVMSVPTDGAIL